MVLIIRRYAQEGEAEIPPTVVRHTDSPPQQQ